MMKWSRRYQLEVTSSRTNDDRHCLSSSSSSASSKTSLAFSVNSQLTKQRSSSDDDDDDNDDVDEDAGSISCRCERLARNPANIDRLNAIKQMLLEHSPATRDRFLATEALMSSARLQRSTFAAMAVIGQQLLDIGQPSESVRVLEAALRVPHSGVALQRVLACVLSTLAAACWSLDRFRASIVYSLRALTVAETQGDGETLCRTYGNLAAMFFMRSCYKLSLRCRHAQLFYCLAAAENRRRRILTALSHLGHTLRATGHNTAAILCHQLCAVSLKRSADSTGEARELMNIGAVYEATARPKTAFHYYSRSLDASERSGDVVGQARVWIVLGRLLSYADVPTGSKTAATASYHTALRLASGDVGHSSSKNISTGRTSTTKF